jgi:hypothetical protein
VAVEVRDVADGLWLWRSPHPDWSAGSDWEPEVASFAVESRGARVLLDPLAPPPREREAWERIDAFAPDTAVVLKADHVRDVDLFVRWYGVKAFGPYLFWRDDVPRVELEPVRPGDELPGGITPTTTAAAAICPRPAAPDRHGPKGSVAPPLSPFGPRRPASTVHGHLAPPAIEPVI